MINPSFGIFPYSLRLPVNVHLWVFGGYVPLGGESLPTRVHPTSSGRQAKTGAAETIEKPRPGRIDPRLQSDMHDYVCFLNYSQCRCLFGVIVHLIVLPFT